MGSRVNRVRVAGVYAIRCLPNGKTYVGSAADLGKRIAQHKAQLRRGDHCLLPRLQKDWDAYGERAFVFYEQPVPGGRSERRRLEDQLIQAWGCLEHMNGYNKMAGSVWGPEASIRNTEDKLARHGKFIRLRGVEWEAPMPFDYVNTFFATRPAKNGLQPGL